MQIMEANPQKNYAFEDLLAAYKDTGYDAKRSQEVLDSKKQDKKETATIQEKAVTEKDNDMQDDDVYM